MGDGQKHEEITFFPVQPPKIMSDPEERECHFEVSIRANNEQLIIVFCF